MSRARSSSMERMKSAAKKISSALGLSHSSDKEIANETGVDLTLEEGMSGIEDPLLDLCRHGWVPLSVWDGGSEAAVVTVVPKSAYGSEAFKYAERHKAEPKTVSWDSDLSLRRLVRVAKIYRSDAIAEYHSSLHERSALDFLQNSPWIPQRLARDEKHNDDPKWVILEACNGGNLAQFLQHTPIWPGEAFLWHTFLELAKAMHFTVVSNEVVHTDLVPVNVVLDTRDLRETGLPNLKLIDWSRYSRKSEDPRAFEVHTRAAMYYIGNILHLIAHGLRPSPGNEDCWHLRDVGTGQCYCQPRGIQSDFALHLSGESLDLYNQVMRVTTMRRHDSPYSSFEEFYVHLVPRAAVMLRTAKAKGADPWLTENGLASLPTLAGWTSDDKIRKQMKKAASKYAKNL